MIAAEKEPCWIVECDECESSEIDSEGEGTTHYVTEKKAHERALSNEWRELPQDGRWICPSCAEMHGWR